MPPEVGSPAVEAVLRARLADAGAITFAEFMAVALYQPEGGYYATTGPGPDFRTAPQTSPAFGHLIGVALARMWDGLSRPTPFHAVELGAGDGLLASQVVGYLAAREPAASASIRYLAIDSSGRGSIGRGDVQACVADARFLPLRRLTGCFLSNELFDALPVHRVLGTDAGPRELWVEWAEDRYVFAPGPLSNDALGEYLDRMGIALPRGQVIDVAPSAIDLLAAIADRLERGFVLTIDYGGEGAELYGQHRRAGTLLAYARHRAVDDPLARPGLQDLTAHVDCGALRRAGEAAGLTTVAYLPLRDFLLGLGLREWVARLDPKHLSPADLFNARMAAAELVREDRLGKFRVLIQARGEVAVPPEILGEGARR